ncbi:MAG TPA: dTMP kinase [Pseudonocardiaceae bacterium]|nr:dTMP kinase [Pseudonocardiaceae bacterium]
MGKLVVVEGLDGAGKRTLTDALTAALRERGASVAGLAFPRYGDSTPADLVRDALHGGLGDLADSVHGMAVLFALDRLGARERIADLRDRHDVLLVDRYIASNAAYGAARLRQDVDGAFVGWVRALEVDRFALPVPDLHLLLRVPVAVAAGRAARREGAEPGRARDAFESDDGLQARCAEVYDQLAAIGWLAPWRVADGGSVPDHARLAEALLTG